jgi:MFS family permease
VKRPNRAISLHAFRGRPPVTVRVWDAAPFGWWPVICISLVSLMDRLEFSVLAGSLTSIKADFGLSDFQVGWLSTASGIASLLLLLPAGRIADRYNRVNVVAAIVILWAVLALATGLAATFLILLVVRIMIGATSRLYRPAASSLVADYYPAESRARAYGLEQFAFAIGGPLGVVIGGVVSQNYGWRWAFVALAVPCLVIALLVRMVREPFRGTADHIDAVRRGDVVPLQHAIHHGEPEPPPRPAVAEMISLLRIPALRSIFVGIGILSAALGGIFFWLPAYYERSFSIGAGTAAGMAGSVGFVGIVIGTIIGVQLGDRRTSYAWRDNYLSSDRTRVRRRIRLGVIGLSTGVGGIIVAIVGVGMPMQMIGFLVANAGFGMAIPNFSAATADLAGAERRGLAFALLQFVIALGTSIGPVFVGAVSDLTGSLGGALGLLVVPLLAGALVTRRAKIEDPPPQERVAP